MSTGILLQDIFEVKDIDPALGDMKKTKKFDKVSRLVCTSEHFDLNMILDINCDIYQVDIGDKLTFALSKTLDLKGGIDEGVYDPLLGTDEKPSLMDKYDYVMYGKVFKFKSEGTKV
jgi:DNA-directed RNA polymerases I, II, and III subunit RPABC3